MRRNDNSTVPFIRSKRFFILEGQWYFQTRENKNVGPLETQMEAEIALKAYLTYQSIQERRLQYAAHG